MMADFKEVVKGYTYTVGEITEEQQRDLTKIFEKRVAAVETQIRHGYFDMKKADNGERMLAFVSNPNNPQTEDTWLTCVYRFCKTLAVARQALFKVAQYGDTSIVHTFPPTNIKPTTSASGWSGPSNTATSASSRSTSDLVQRRFCDGCDSTGSRVPILPGTDSTGSYRVLLLYTTVRLSYRLGHLQRPLRS